MSGLAVDRSLPGTSFIRLYGIIFHTVNQGQLVSRGFFLLISQNIRRFFVYYSAPLPRLLPVAIWQMLGYTETSSKKRKEMIKMSFDLRQTRTTLVRPSVRATAEEISIELKHALSRNDSQTIRRIIGSIPLSGILWNQIVSIIILGDSNEPSLPSISRLENAGLDPGAYINYDCTCLLLLYPSNSTIHDCLSKCSSHLNRLEICETRLSHLDISAMTELQKLVITDDRYLLHIDILELLPKLVTIDISWCLNLRQLSYLDNLPSLTSLSISHCRNIRKIPDELRRINSLRSLNLCSLHLQDLPDWLPEIAQDISISPIYTQFPGSKKAVVCLENTTVETIPDMSIFYQPYAILAEWFLNRSKGDMKPLNEIKVIFLGDGEAGKSHTIARLMNDGGDPVDYTDKSTPGIVIKHKDYELDDRKFRVHYWDFGGQEILHSMHRIFLTNRTMYVVLLNARDDTQDDRAHYWLHNIKSFAPNAPVLLVLNKIDQNDKASVDEHALRSRYESLTRVIRLSALTFRRDRFNKVFTNVLLTEIQKTGFLDFPWPTSWTRVKGKLENMTTHYIKGDTYQSICAECQVENNRKNLLRWFNDLGISFCWCDEEDYALEDHVILRPDWITNALYIILFNRLENAHNGLIPHKSIYNILKNASENPNIRCTLPQAKYNVDDIHYVLGVMRKFNLSFDDTQGSEFIPMLCQQNSAVDVSACQKHPDIMEFNMEFDYLPDNLLHQLMVERRNELVMTTTWRKGALFELEKPGFSAVVAIEGKTLHFFIHHTNPMHRPNTYLTMLKANVDRIVKKMGLKEPACYLTYKLNGKKDTFDYEVLQAMQEAGQKEAFSMTWKRMIPIESILNQSAPDGLQNEMLLLTAIREACGRIQDEPIYRLVKNENGKGYKNGSGMEDLRNRRVRDDLLILLTKQYWVCDQTQIGSSGSGKSVGELDLLIRKENNEPWTIIEALRTTDGTKASWNSHLDKLLVNYNSRSLSLLYLLTYVDADPAAFATIWNGYLTYIPGHTAGQYHCIADTFSELDNNKSQSFKVAKCQYTCGDDPITVYHIFARIPTENG